MIVKEAVFGARVRTPRFGAAIAQAALDVGDRAPNSASPPAIGVPGVFTFSRCRSPLAKGAGGWLVLSSPFGVLGRLPRSRRTSSTRPRLSSSRWASKRGGRVRPTTAMCCPKFCLDAGLVRAIPLAPTQTKKVIRSYYGRDAHA